MMGDGAALLYRKAFILSAGLDFAYADDDARRHITNLSVNKRFAGHPGQVPCDLLAEYPEVRCKSICVFVDALCMCIMNTAPHVL